VVVQVDANAETVVDDSGDDADADADADAIVVEEDEDELEVIPKRAPKAKTKATTSAGTKKPTVSEGAASAKRASAEKVMPIRMKPSTLAKDAAIPDPVKPRRLKRDNPTVVDPEPAQKSKSIKKTEAAVPIDTKKKSVVVDRSVPDDLDDESDDGLALPIMNISEYKKRVGQGDEALKNYGLSQSNDIKVLFPSLLLALN